MNEGGLNILKHAGALGFIASAAGTFDTAKGLMDALRSKHANVASELEVLLTEIGSRFVNLPEERLLAVVNALLHPCYKYPTATTAEVPQSLKRELSGVFWACFSPDAVKKHVDFVRDYKQDFEHHLDPESAATFPASLSDLTERLKHWKNVLQSNIEDRFPSVLKLEEESRVLRGLHITDVEVPGQHFTYQEIAPDHTVKLDRVAADIPIVRRNGSSFHCLTLVGSDGSQRHFIVQTSLTPNAKTDERILRLFRMMNQMFEKHKESRRCHMCIHTPIIIPVWPQESQYLWHHLAMFFRDELLSSSWKRPLGISMGHMGGGQRMNPIGLKQNITTSVERVIMRVKGMAPQNFFEEEEYAMDQSQPVQRGVTELVEAALNPRNLYMMDPNWHPWF